MKFKEVFLFVVLAVLLSKAATASLGISPAIVKIGFVSSEMREVSYIIFSDQPEKKISISASGDLANYITFDKTEVIGQSSFKAIINFPKDVPVPGDHRVDIIVKEQPTEDQFIGTAIEIHSALKIFVPYPGRYVEVILNVQDGNIDETIPVEAHIFNIGQDSINLDYGEVIKVNKTFRVGSLFVNITNFTHVVTKGKIQKFYVGVESLWNGDLNEVYADVNISNSSYSYDFRTPSITLKAWTSDVLTGFLDTEGLEGRYDTRVVLNYANQKTNVLGSLLVVAGLSKTYIYVGLVGILLMIVIVVILRIKKGRLSFSKLIRLGFKGKGER